MHWMNNRIAILISPLLSFVVSDHMVKSTSPCFLFFNQPENIMLSDKMAPHPDIKIIDFGLAHHFMPGEEYRSMSGTPQYIRE